ncbi:SO2930 family diheme c-type cytochrome [Hyphomonas sp.]|uniref:SO2930 family diheme c-type cytochrome n=1 Tax=Hyphomonas sp. TaxID=87 RepID=UPI00391C5DF8
MRFWAIILAGVAGLFLAACSAGARAPSGPDMAVILADQPAATLSAYGLFTDLASGSPADGVMPYELINPLFTDHADKHRFVYLPPGKAAAFHETDVFDFPVGTVLVKSFAFAPDMRRPEEGAYLVETRLLIRREAGWVAYPYVWNAAQTEAVYTPAGLRQDIETITPAGEPVTLRYAVPNQNQCKTCHLSGRDIAPIGPKARHLALDGPPHGNQLEAWARAGILTGLPGEVAADARAYDPWQKLDARARAWLEINCAHCHKADGSASNSGLWLTADEQSAARLGINKHPVAAGRGSGGLLQVIVPGAPEESILLHRIASTEPGVAMPELGQSVPDPQGIALVRDWIAAMEAR